MDSSQLALLLAAVAVVGVVAFLIGQWRGREREKATLDELLRQPQGHGYLAEADLVEILRSNLSSDAFKLQHQFESASGKPVRADATVRVGDSIVPIDSKYPLEPFKQVVSAKPDSPFERTAASKFRNAVKGMIDQIASKYIRPDEETLDFAMMYIPAEVIYHRAILDEAIVDYATERSVLLVSPGSLFAYLSVVDRGQRGVKLDESTAEVLGRIETVRRDLEEFRRTYATLGKHIGSAQRKHEEASTQVDQLQKRLDRTLDGGSKE